MLRLLYLFGDIAMKLGKSFHFDAAHKLPGHDKCGCIHGHTYTVTVIVKGATGSPTTEYPGMVMDLHNLSYKVNRIIELLDHKCINEVYPDFYPTCENLVSFFLSRLDSLMPQNVTEVTVRIQEGLGGFAEDTWKI